jgi:hypothetical protein
MTPEQLATTILAIVGVITQLLFMYIPALKKWLDASPNKGLIMLGVILVVSLIYFGLACSALAAQLNIFLSCDVAGAILLAKAFVIIALSQQMTYLFTRNSRFFKTAK